MDQTYVGGKFSIPPNFDFNVLPNKDRKICVISIIGQSDLFLASNKASHVDDLVTRNAFTRFQVGLPDLNPVTIEDGISENGTIEGFYHAEKRVIYLHLKGIYDTSRMADLCDVIKDENIKLEEIANIITQEDFHYAKLVLYLFHVSHVVLVSTIGADLDTTYIRFFKFIDSLRNSLGTQMVSILRILAVSREWCNFGRPCSPRILFVFNLTPSTLTKALANHPEKIEKLQHTLEDKIFQIFRKTRLVTDSSNNCLFTIPSNQPFVLICLPSHPTKLDKVDDYLQRLINLTTTSNDSSCTIRQADPHIPDSNNNSFSHLIYRHVNEALTGRGFEDIKNRHTVFELPTCRAWFKVCHKLYTALLTDQAESGVKNKLNHAASLYDVRTLLSDSRCRKGLPLAEMKYREDLPPHYSRAIHLSKVVLARRFFLTCARGPCTGNYLDKLESLCDRVWLTGRQMCDAVSINGQPCRYEVHKVPKYDSVIVKGTDQESTSVLSLTNQTSRDKSSVAPSDSQDGGQQKEGSEEDLPELAHRSHFQLRSACNCGNMQAQRQDPFDWYEANVEFFRRLAEICCDKFQGIRLPPLDDLEESQCGLNDDDPSSSTSYSLEQGSSTSGREARSSTSTSLEEDWEREDWMDKGARTKGETESSEDTAVSTAITVAKPSTTKKKSVRAARGVKFFGMLNDSTPDWKIPSHSSWSVLNVGKYFSYSHANGIEQQGFLQGSNFLLPWDVTVRSKSWIADNEYHKKSKGKIRGKQESNAATVKVFIGFEYECPVGHRFFLAGPKRMMKGAMQGCQVKEAVQGLLSRPLPLYFPCQCYQSSAKGYLAQLMRVYAAVPNSPINVTLSLRVKPGPGSDTPIFHPGNREAILLTPGNVWVARLPAAYQDDGRVYRMPQEPSSLDQCQLLKGSLSYVEITDAPAPPVSRKGSSFAPW